MSYGNVITMNSPRDLSDYSVELGVDIFLHEFREHPHILLVDNNFKSIAAKIIVHLHKDHAIKLKLSTTDLGNENGWFLMSKYGNVFFSPGA